MIMSSIFVMHKNRCHQITKKGTRCKLSIYSKADKSQMCYIHYRMTNIDKETQEDIQKIQKQEVIDLSKRSFFGNIQTPLKNLNLRNMNVAFIIMAICIITHYIVKYYYYKICERSLLNVLFFQSSPFCMLCEKTLTLIESQFFQNVYKIKETLIDGNSVIYHLLIGR